MESDTDSETELPPGWEVQLDSDKIIYVNHVTQERKDTHPLKLLRAISKGVLNPKFKASRTCIPRSKSVSTFIQKFDSFSTAEHVLGNRDLSQKLAVVTGGCSGIGLETVYHLVSANCRVILGCPDVRRCRLDVETRIGCEAAICSLVTIVPLDLTSFSSVNQFVEAVSRASPDRLDLIILCGGLMSPPFDVTADGHEIGLQVNLLSQALLTLQLLACYCHIETEIRTVFCACESHRAITSLDLADLTPSQDNYDGLSSYALHNLCRLLFVRAMSGQWLSSRCAALSTGKRLFYSCHPGNLVSGTKLGRYSCIWRGLTTLCQPFTKTLSQASAVVLYCSLHSGVAHFSGDYFNNCCLCEPSIPVSDSNTVFRFWKYVMSVLEPLIGPDSK